VRAAERFSTKQPTTVKEQAGIIFPSVRDEEDLVREVPADRVGSDRDTRLDIR
jgi:hypothetical protein